MPEALIDPRFLFRFAVPVRYHKSGWTGGLNLGPEYRLLSLAELDGKKVFGDVRACWNEKGLGFRVEVRGKKQPIWCRESRMEDSDGLQVWVDTRDTHNVHRATRFCHRFAFMPAGGGRKFEEPVAEQLIINRARENAPPVRLQSLQIASQRRSDGYVLEAFLPSSALTGFDAQEHPRLGFTYAVFDRELGLQTFSVGTCYPYEEDPSVWATLELIRDGSLPKRA